MARISTKTQATTPAGTLIQGNEPTRFAPLAFSDASLNAAKWLALVLMVIDHSNKYLFGGSVHWMFALGRISMPLFAFTLGYNLARSGMLANGGYRRLSIRLALFGLLATAPFIVVNKLAHGWPLNMMFTLLVAVVTAWLLDTGGRLQGIVAWLVFAWAGAASEYWWPAIGLCLCVWAYQRKTSGAAVFGFAVCLISLWFINGNFWALASVPVLALVRYWPYRLPRAQWFFYGFYPLHLAFFWCYLTYLAKA
ncbi:conjugal transfer protein TraX [Aquabacterium soli]|uniref:Conjugal transfer protein TraX n=1 Tax=Aquabacterium soli TaxID=2493092 RepID=A0A3R8YJY5_9BURK|nr:TraX family protein [Aquabacterium soli]RRS01149.1 conjugal transfer protein TraX [Aquabacterium soli]